MLKKIKELFQKLKTFVIKNWVKILNWLVLIIVYAKTTQVGLETIVGLLIFIQISWASWLWFNKKKVS